MFCGRSWVCPPRRRREPEVGTRTGLPRRSGRPPEPAYFRGLWKPLGYRSAAIEMAGLSLRFDGMDDSWWRAFLTLSGPYARDTTTDRGAFTLTLSAARDRKDHAKDFYIEPPPPGEAEYNPVFLEVKRDAAGSSSFDVRVCTYRLAASFPSAGGR